MAVKNFLKTKLKMRVKVIEKLKLEDLFIDENDLIADMVWVTFSDMIHVMALRKHLRFLTKGYGASVVQHFPKSLETARRQLLAYGRTLMPRQFRIFLEEDGLRFVVWDNRTKPWQIVPINFYDVDGN